MNFDDIEGLTEENIQDLYNDVVDGDIAIQARGESGRTQYQSGYVQCSNGRYGFATSYNDAYPYSYCGSHPFYTAGRCSYHAGYNCAHCSNKPCNEHDIIIRVCGTNPAYGYICITDCRNN